MKEFNMNNKNNFKIVLTIPAGRRQYMEILFKHIVKEYDLLDEIRLWVNSRNIDDISWMTELSAKYDKVTLDKTVYNNPSGVDDLTLELHRFWENCKDENTLYLRLDDDVVWLEEHFFKKLIDFRLSNPEPLFVYPNIINNAIIDHLHQRLGCFNSIDKIEYNCFDYFGVMDGHHAELRHNEFIKDIKNNDLDKYKFGKWSLYNYERVSINSLAWFGKDIKNLEFDVEEEDYVSCVAPKILGRPNMIYGGILASHFSFHTQIEYLNPTDILIGYSELL
jgi:hypothetical protein